VALPSLASIEATGICIPMGNCKVLLATVYKSPYSTWCDKDITELSGVQTNKAALEFKASIASAYRLSTSKVKLSELNSDISN
jgi:hypothetical protein